MSSESKQWGVGALQSTINDGDITTKGNFPLTFTTALFAQAIGYNPSNTSGIVTVLIKNFTNQYLEVIYDQYGSPSRNMSSLWLAIGR